MKWLLIPILFIIVIIFFPLSSTEKYVQEKKEVTESSSTPLIFVGDIMLGRYVETLSIKENNPSRSFQEVKDFLKEGYSIANLEGPIPYRHEPTPINGFSFSFASSTGDLLKEGGIKAVSLANNHMYDKGSEGYKNTMQVLDKSNVKYFGGYAPTLSYSEFPLGNSTATILGFSMISSLWDEEKAVEVVKQIRSQQPSSHLIVFLHWGDEYKTQNIYQRTFAHRIIDLGVDTVIGAHPHVVQGIEMYKGKLIIYSLGNFIFDQYWDPRLEDGLALKITSLRNTLRYELVPIRSSRSIPYIATSTEKIRILETVAEQSSPDIKDFVRSGVILIEKQ